MTSRSSTGSSECMTATETSPHRSSSTPTTATSRMPFSDRMTHAQGVEAVTQHRQIRQAVGPIRHGDGEMGYYAVGITGVPRDRAAGHVLRHRQRQPGPVRRSRPTTPSRRATPDLQRSVVTFTGGPSDHDAPSLSPPPTRSVGCSESHTPRSGGLRHRRGPAQRFAARTIRAKIGSGRGLASAGRTGVRDDGHGNEAAGGQGGDGRDRL
jgi:hypothetical protein